MARLWDRLYIYLLTQSSLFYGNTFFLKCTVSQVN